MSICFFYNSNLICFSGNYVVYENTVCKEQVLQIELTLEEQMHSTSFGVPDISKCENDCFHATQCLGFTFYDLTETGIGYVCTFHSALDPVFRIGATCFTKRTGKILCCANFRLIFKFSLVWKPNLRKKLHWNLPDICCTKKRTQNIILTHKCQPDNFFFTSPLLPKVEVFFWLQDFKILKNRFLQNIGHELTNWKTFFFS